MTPPDRPARAARPRPAETVRQACRRWGEPAVAHRCARLLAAATDATATDATAPDATDPDATDPDATDLDPTKLDPADLELLGYLAATPSLTAPTHGTWPAWYPVWAARGLRYAWRPDAAAAVRDALGHPRWRVREMAAHVCRDRELGEAGDALAVMAADPVPRVRVAAARALAVTGEAEHAPALQRLLADDDLRCRDAARQALRRLAGRLDRDLPA